MPWYVPSSPLRLNHRLTVNELPNLKFASAGTVTRLFEKSAYWAFEAPETLTVPTMSRPFPEESLFGVPAAREEASK